MWELIDCPSTDSGRLKDLLGQGWEPFAVTAGDGGFVTSTIWLRRLR